MQAAPSRRYWLVVLVTPWILGGCADVAKDKPSAAAPKPRAAAKEDETEIKANLAKLSPDDRKLAETQKYCPIESANRLGSMGKPFKVLVKDRPVFLCCKMCEKKALAEADKTLAKVQELTGGKLEAEAAGAAKPETNPSAAKDDEGEIKANLAKLAPDDRKLAEAQKYCPIESANRLGSMGKPLKVLVKDQPVFLCCKLCEKKALAEADKTLAKVQDLRKASADASRSPPSGR